MLCAVFREVTSIHAFSLHVGSEYLQHSKTSYLLALFCYNFFRQAFNSDEVVGLGGRGKRTDASGRDEL